MRTHFCTCCAWSLYSIKYTRKRSIKCMFWQILSEKENETLKEMHLGSNQVRPFGIVHRWPLKPASIWASNNLQSKWRVSCNEQNPYILSGVHVDVCLWVCQPAYGLPVAATSPFPFHSHHIQRWLTDSLSEPALWPRLQRIAFDIEYIAFKCSNSAILPFCHYASHMRPSAMRDMLITAMHYAGEGNELLTIP